MLSIIFGYCCSNMHVSSYMKMRIFELLHSIRLVAVCYCIKTIHEQGTGLTSPSTMLVGQTLQNPRKLDQITM